MSVPRTQPEMFADLYRRIEQLESKAETRKRTGLVKEVDAAKGLARVVLGKDAVSGDEMLSPWIAWDEMAMGAIKHHTPPSVGEQVTVESENGEFTDARIKTSVPSDANPRPHDKENEHVRTVGNVRILEKDGEVQIKVGALSITIANGKIILDGEVEMTKSLKVAQKVENGGDMTTGGVHTDSVGGHQ